MEFISQLIKEDTFLKQESQILMDLKLKTLNNSQILNHQKSTTSMSAMSIETPTNTTYL